MELNEEKTNVIVVRGKCEKDRIGKYKIVKETKYLGIQMGGHGRDIFAAENKLLIQKAEKKASELIREIKCSCDMVLVGRSVWKTMNLPAILYGRAVVPTSETNIIKLQRVENRV